MNLTGTKTLLNLARAFAGESQAKNRYIFYAQKAREEGYANIAAIMDEIIRNEMAHAQAFFNHIINGLPNGKGIENIAFDAGYPFQEGETLENMIFAATAEKDECDEIYPGFAKIAEEEGFKAIAFTYTQIAKIEGSHHNIFNKLYEQLQNGTLYNKKTPVEWKCSHCGHTQVGNQPWEICPVCGKPKGFVEILLKMD